MVIHIMDTTAQKKISQKTLLKMTYRVIIDTNIIIANSGL